MSIVLDLPPQLETDLQDGARRIGISVADYMIRLLAARRGRFDRHIGSVDLGRPTGTDNEGIDADLERAAGEP